MHRLDANKTAGEEARRQLHKNVESNIEQVLAATPKQKQDDQLEHTYSSYVRVRYVALKTCQRRLTIGRSGERGSEISMLVARHDDDIYTPCKLFAQSAGAVEYTDCTSAEG